MAPGHCDDMLWLNYLRYLGMLFSLSTIHGLGPLPREYYLENEFTSKGLFSKLLKENQNLLSLETKFYAGYAINEFSPLFSINFHNVFSPLCRKSFKDQEQTLIVKVIPQWIISNFPGFVG
ncbi:hypothetical protein TBCH5v1_1615 [Thermococcus barophilus]|uniref:Uncharacterized protein n=1 Tax=Thermococcus barophilus TaxID=55802 RepID=A0A0S1XCR6_THEBA|nr:hypothetical protein TBCH5v1_1615 [Thermococcus barophilus]